MSSLVLHLNCKFIDQKLPALKYAHKKDNKVTLLWLLPLNNLAQKGMQLIKTAPKYVKILSLNLPNANIKIISAIHAAGHQANLYTIDNIADTLKAISLDADSFFTNDAPASKALLQNQFPDHADSLVAKPE